MKKLVLFFALWFSYSAQSFGQFAGGDGTSLNPYQVSTIEQLQLIGDDLHLYFDNHFIQINDLNAGVTRDWNDGAGFLPIGNATTEFSGTYDGDGFTIDSLYIKRFISRFEGERSVGLFGKTENALLRNIKLTNIYIEAHAEVGGLVGNASGIFGRIENVQVQGEIKANFDFGGVAGAIDEITMNEVSADVYISPIDVGGNTVGGLVGIARSSARIDRSFSSGHVDAVSTDFAGGLIGVNQAEVFESYSVAEVIGDNRVGGLIGHNLGEGLVTNTYYAGEVSGFSNVGAFVGYNIDGGVFTNSYYDADLAGGIPVAGDGTSDGIIGLTTLQMTGNAAKANMTGFNFVAAFATMENDYPVLLWSIGFLGIEVTQQSTELLEGDTFSVEVEVRNRGGQPESQVIRLKKGDGTVLDSVITQTLGRAKTELITLNWLTQMGDEGAQILTISSDDESKGVEVLVFDEPGVPELSNPANEEENLNTSVILSWNEALLAVYYEIEVSTSTEFGDDIILSDTTSEESFFIQSGVLSHLTEYFWRVRSKAGVLESDWSDIWSFTTIISAPVLLSPESEAMEVDIPTLFTWEIVEGADDYELHVATDILFSELVDASAKTKQVFSAQIDWMIAQEVAGLEPDTVYYWRVRSIRNGNSSNWSESRMFATVSSVEPDIRLITPTEGSVEIDLTPHFYWSSNTEGSFLLEYSQDSLFASSSSVELDSVGYVSLEELADNSKYYWKVSAMKGAELVAESEKGSFWTNTELEPPLSFDLLSPVNNTVFEEVEQQFSWSKALDNDPLDVAQYRLLVSKYENFETEVLTFETGTDTTIVIGEELDTDSQYFWKVEAVDTDSLVTTSEVFTFNSIVLISNEIDNKPQVYTLDQNYPNPFNPGTEIAYSLPNSGHVKLTVINSVGREVATLVNGFKNSGSHTVSFTANNLSSGVYFYRLEAGSFTKTMKMLLVK